MNQLLFKFLLFFQFFILISLLAWWYSSSLRYGKNNNTFEAKPKDQTSRSSLFVALSANNDLRYAYLLPFVVEGWLRCGVQPVFVLIENEKTWQQHKCTSLVLTYLHKKKTIVKHFSDHRLIQKHKSSILARTSRIAVPHILKEMGMPSDAIMWTGDADVIPLKCDYFKSIPHTMNERNVKVYMDALWDISVPRYLMCYIAAYLSTWDSLTEEGSSLEDVMENILRAENVQMAYGNSNRTVPGIDFDERFLGKRIKQLSCFPNCTTHGQRPVRNYVIDKRGPGRPPYDWRVALGKNSQETLNFLGRLTEAHSGVGRFSFYGQGAWPLLHGLLAIYMERETVKQLSQFAADFFQLDC